MVFRAAFALSFVAFLAFPAAAVDPVVVYVDPDSGHFWAGLGELGAESVNRRSYDVTVDQCHRRLSFSLQYDPKTASVSHGGNAVEVAYTFRVEVRNETSGFSRATDVSSPGDAFPLGVVPSAGHYVVQVQMGVGIDVDWTFALRGLDVLRFAPAEWEPACAVIRIIELEANPAGTDAGYEWLELHNEEATDVDVSGWTLTTLGGVTQTWTLPAGTTIAADGLLVVNFTAGQFLDNEDEGVVLTNPWRIETDRTAILSDTRNDARTNQWVELPGGSFGWAFQNGTAGKIN